MSDPRRLWRRLPHKAKLAIASTAVVSVLIVAFMQPWASVYNAYVQRRDQSATMSAVLAEAKSLGLTFPHVVVASSTCVGKPVYWPIIATSVREAYANGRPAWPIRWTDSGRHDWGSFGVKADAWVLARVASVNDGAVYLDYVGIP